MCILVMMCLLVKAVRGNGNTFKPTRRGEENE